MRRSFTLPLFVLFFSLITITTTFAAESKDLNVLSGWQIGAGASNQLLQELNRQAFSHLAARSQAVSSIQTADAWKKRQQEVKQKLQTLMGPFPKKTPLNAQVMGIVQKDGFRIEKILFESRPQFYVTGCLFIPDGLTQKTPAILNPIGHTDIAFRDDLYQQLFLNLVKKGFIVFSFDPLSQGERLQYFDADAKKSLVGGSTSEHSHFGRQCFLNGISAGQYFVWDGIRAIDYLLTREEVDPNRIAVTGLSGGGTQTAYISALDDRVAVSAPTCYITSFRRLLESIGPQDAEQNLIRQIASGLDHADFIEVRSPKPTLMVTTTNDFFSIQGARETFAEAKRAFEAMGSGDHLQMVEDDFTHGYTPKNMEALYAFMQKHLNLPGDPTHHEMEQIPVEDLTVTPTGQISTALQSKRVYDFNLKDTDTNIHSLIRNRTDAKEHTANVKKAASQLSGYRSADSDVQEILMGGHPNDNYRMEKYAVPSEGSCIIPLLVFIPNAEGPHPAALLFHPQGKSHIVQESDIVNRLILQNHIVAVADLSGLGEVGESVSGIKAAYTALQIGRSIPGFHAGEMNRIARVISKRKDVTADQIAAIAYGDLGPALLHAAALENVISKALLCNSLSSYRSIAATLLYKTPEWIETTGSLQNYDLPDLAACIAPRAVALIGPLDAGLQPVSKEEFEKDYEFVQQTYDKASAGKKLKVTLGQMEESAITNAILDFLKEEN